MLYVAMEQHGTPLTEDVCVPRSRLSELMTGVERIAADSDLLIGCGGHAGDGNVHPIIVFDPADADQKRQAYEAFDAIMALGLELGGTITGEHGVGIENQRAHAAAITGEREDFPHLGVLAALEVSGRLRAEVEADARLVGTIVDRVQLEAERDAGLLILEHARGPEARLVEQRAIARGQRHLPEHLDPRLGPAELARERRPHAQLLDALREEMVARVPSSRLEIYPGATHYLPLEFPDRLARDARTFFEETHAG